MKPSPLVIISTEWQILCVIHDNTPWFKQWPPLKESPSFPVPVIGNGLIY